MTDSLAAKWHALRQKDRKDDKRKKETAAAAGSQDAGRATEAPSSQMWKVMKSHQSPYFSARLISFQK